MKRIYFLAVFCSVFLHTYSQVPMSELLGYYKFDHSLVDSSGNENHANGSASSYTADRLGNEESALVFNGINDSVIISIPEFTPLNGDFTISFWMKTHSPEKQNLFSIKQTPFDTTGNFEIQLNSNSVLQTVMELYYGFYTYWEGSGWTGNKLAEGAPGLYYNNKWHHFVINRANDTIRIWHNRDLHAESYCPGVIGDELPLIISSFPYRFKGTIDDIAIYNRSVSEKEIMNLYHDKQPFIFKSPKSTDAYQQIDTTYVHWLWDSTQVSDSIDLEYSVNAGPWIATTHNQLEDWNGFYLPLNYLPNTKIDIRVSDHNDSYKFAQTGAFTISSYQWQLVNPTLPFTSRDGSGLLSLNDKLWLIGGWDPPYHEATYYTCSEIWSSPDGITWDYHGDAPWPERHISGWLKHDNALWIIGGDPQSGCLRDVWKSTDGISWTMVLDTIPNLNPLRSSYMTASMGGNMYYFGGQPIQYIRENLNEVWRSADGEIWEQLPDAPWQPRGMILNSCVDESDQLWMLGGGRLFDRACFSDVWKTSDGINWEMINEVAPWQPRYWHNVAWFDNKMWVITGSAYQVDNSETWYSENGVDWYELKNSPFNARHAAAATVFNNALWLMTGIASNDCWKLINTEETVEIEINIEEVILFNIYPNPNSGAFTLSLKSALTNNQALISIINISGVEVFSTSEEFLNGELTLEINLEIPLPSGIYFVRIKSGESEKMMKMIVD